MTSHGTRIRNKVYGDLHLTNKSIESVPKLFKDRMQPVEQVLLKKNEAAGEEGNYNKDFEDLNATCGLSH